MNFNILSLNRKLYALLVVFFFYLSFLGLGQLTNGILDGPTDVSDSCRIYENSPDVLVITNGLGEGVYGINTPPSDGISCSGLVVVGTYFE